MVLYNNTIKLKCNYNYVNKHLTCLFAEVCGDKYSAVQSLRDKYEDTHGNCSSIKHMADSVWAQDCCALCRSGNKCVREEDNEAGGEIQFTC